LIFVLETKKHENSGKEIWSAKTKDVTERAETIKAAIWEY